MSEMAEGVIGEVQFTFKILETNELGEHFIFMSRKGTVLGYHLDGVIQVHIIVALNFMREMMDFLVGHFKTDKVEFCNVLMPALPEKLKGFEKIRVFDKYLGQEITVYRGTWNFKSSLS